MSDRFSRRDWEQVYMTWKEAHPEMMGDDQKPARRKLIRGCIMKCPHKTYEDAMAIVSKLPLFPGRVLNAYQCPICNAFHVGNTSLRGSIPHPTPEKIV